MKPKDNLFYLLFLLSIHTVQAQDIPVPVHMGKPHPRVMTTSIDKSALHDLIRSNEWAEKVFQQTKDRLDPYVDRHQTDPEWIVSRLQMYWNSKVDQVYINGGKYSHADGEAPVPTVKYPGTRDHTTVYRRPKLEDVRPYMDDEKGLYFQNNSKEGAPWEWADHVQTGRIIESINKEIIGMAQTAAFLYWASDEEKYARFATDIFDTYMAGVHHLKEPKDISNGHHQTLVGYTSFEVIQENNLDDLTICYDFLFDYLQQEKANKMDLYAVTFKKWADQIIKNGVTFNNWNLHQARHIGKVAMILEDDDAYEDGKGAQFYLNQIMNENAVRQWSMTKLLDYGYDPENGIWNESPGYAMGMVNDFLYFVEQYEQQFDIDLIPYMPVLLNASEVLTEYMLPSRLAVGFGDTHYRGISTESMKHLIRNARHFNKPDQEIKFTSILKFLDDSWQEESSNPGKGNNWQALFSEEKAKIREDIPAARPEEVMSSLFYAPNVSWLVQRSGLDKANGLMISQAASYGNHAHAHGIAMELYGKGLPLAPEKGIGTSYFSIDYDEYYSRFPAHNTVVVNGISNYPVMKSNHPFMHLASYPASGQKEGIAPGVTFSDLYFAEPETSSDQRRQMGIIRTGETTGYYVDVFRSRQQEGKDIKHDYFYHNLGHTLEMKEADGQPMSMEPTERLGFADGDLMGYDYLWDKKTAPLTADAKGTFTLEIPEMENINMHFWIKGDQDREVFTVKSPPSKAMRGGHVMVEELEKMPVPALVIRQNGAAWNRPFVAIYEPSNGNSSIKVVQYFEGDERNPGFVGVKVCNKSEREDLIFSSEKSIENSLGENKVEGTYGVISATNGKLNRLFLGDGTKISAKGYTVLAKKSTSAVLTQEGNDWYFTCEAPVVLKIKDSFGKKSMVLKVNGKEIKGEKIKSEGVILFSLPKTAYSKIIIE